MSSRTARSKFVRKVCGMELELLATLRRNFEKLVPPVWLLSVQGIDCSRKVKWSGPRTLGSSGARVHERGHPYSGVGNAREERGTLQPHVCGQNMRVFTPVGEAASQ